jgi:hypothetical protein
MGVNVKRAFFCRNLPPEALFCLPPPADPPELLRILGGPSGQSSRSIGVGPIEIRATFSQKQFWASENLKPAA